MPKNKCAAFRYYGELNDFLPPSRRFRSFVHNFEMPASVKDIIESMGVPHTEVELILIDGTPVNFSHAVQDGEQVSVYPAFRAIDTSPLPQLRPRLREARFVLDIHLGRLARYLRLFGFDALYENDCEDKELARISHDEQRILLTRDCGLLKRSEVVYGFFIRSTGVKEQVIEVFRRFPDCFRAVAPFHRCLRCNALLKSIAKESIAERLQPKTRQHFGEFRICPGCHRIYWAGSHYDRMKTFVEVVLAEAK